MIKYSQELLDVLYAEIITHKKRRLWINSLWVEKTALIKCARKRLRGFQSLKKELKAIMQQPQYESRVLESVRETFEQRLEEVVLDITDVNEEIKGMVDTSRTYAASLSKLDSAIMEITVQLEGENCGTTQE